ncbi:hypothetical protein HYH02_015131 [Chlamydomonas schloesseri]|uniref:Phosphatidic acid phosphatase type 2/haloperoxidase domain-containing protein n=1 Tax=Chlamydomonas schloesseri TaxID=2026947 RepID=A0A835SD35_9CHLO|nr:hypothetical protein HYH02_015131 [Chlamydomonas schloesseri]|eukprot:KAG2424749.1 hypothetical protein HYH02_015131 [Chlamydomonas schloesseri]
MAARAPEDVEANFGADDSRGKKQQQPLWKRFLTSQLTWDGVAAASCLLLALLLELATPRNTYILKETLYWHAYPKKENTVPSASVPLYSLIGPFVVFIVYRFVVKRSNYEVGRLTVALCLAYFLTGAITNCLKLPVGRLRPNFVRTCWPNGTIVLSNEDQWGGYAVCDPSVPQSDVDEVHKSWPSGHSSLSAAGLGFLTFWLLGQLRAFAAPSPWFWGAASAAAPPSKGRQWRFLVAILPSLGAVAVGVTRVLDYWHFPSDVLTGLGIGFLTAFFVYRLIYPPLTHPRCDLPWDHLERVEAAARLAAGAGGGALGAVSSLGNGGGLAQWGHVNWAYGGSGGGGDAGGSLGGRDIEGGGGDDKAGGDDDNGALVTTPRAASVLSVGDGGHGCWCGTEAGSATTGHSQHDPLVITMLQPRAASGYSLASAGPRGASVVSTQAVMLEGHSPLQPELGDEGTGGVGSRPGSRLGSRPASGAVASGLGSRPGSGRGWDEEGRLMTPKADRGRGAARGVVQRRVLRVLT